LELSVIITEGFGEVSWEIIVYPPLMISVQPDSSGGIPLAWGILVLPVLEREVLKALPQAAKMRYIQPGKAFSAVIALANTCAELVDVCPVLVNDAL
jgi:hypothetical protein